MDTLLQNSWFAWVSDNREWLFQGIGLSVTLFVIGIIWQAICSLSRVTWLGCVAIVSLAQRSPPPLPDPTQPQFLITPTEEERRRYEKTYGYGMSNDERMMHSRSAPSASYHVGKAASAPSIVAGGGGNYITKLLILAALLNLLWVAIRAYL